MVGKTEWSLLVPLPPPARRADTTRRTDWRAAGGRGGGTGRDSRGRGSRQEQDIKEPSQIIFSSC